jgi:hypothetical protein
VLQNPARPEPPQAIYAHTKYGWVVQHMGSSTIDTKQLWVTLPGAPADPVVADPTGLAKPDELTDPKKRHGLSSGMGGGV